MVKCLKLFQNLHLMQYVIVIIKNENYELVRIKQKKIVEKSIEFKNNEIL